jgi:hypothetical protein
MIETKLLLNTSRTPLSPFQLVFMWTPSHVGLAGNSAADTAAEAALLMPVSNLTTLLRLLPTDQNTRSQSVAGFMESRDSEQTTCNRTNGKHYQILSTPTPRRNHHSSITNRAYSLGTWSSVEEGESTSM